MHNTKNYVCNIVINNISYDLHYLWHLKFGHVSFNKVSFMPKNDLIPICFQQSHNYNTCMLNKITRTSFKSVERKSKILDLVHSELCDFHSTPSLGNKRYVITFIDDYSKFLYIYLLHTKDEALNFFKAYKNEVELQVGSILKNLRTDKGGE